VVDHRKFSSESTDKVLAPSIDATQWSEDENLVPCPICERTFTAKALERHSNICQKVSSSIPKKLPIAIRKYLELVDKPNIGIVYARQNFFIGNPEDNS